MVVYSKVSSILLNGIYLRKVHVGLQPNSWPFSWLLS